MTKDSLHGNLLKRDFWSRENLKYVEPHFRLYKIANVLTKLSKGKNCDLLDIGCGPAALAKLLPNSINYFGMDIAIQSPSSNLIELDIINNKIMFGDRSFDFVIASGLFEYLGNHQREKFSEIHNITKQDGYFIMSYVNFDHINKRIWPRYSNVQSVNEMKRDINSFFYIKKIFPTFHYWVGAEPSRKIIQNIQSDLYFNLPVLSSLFADEFVYICTPRR